MYEPMTIKLHIIYHHADIAIPYSEEWVGLNCVYLQLALWFFLQVKAARSLKKVEGLVESDLSWVIKSAAQEVSHLSDVLS